MPEEEIVFFERTPLGAAAGNPFNYSKENDEEGPITLYHYQCICCGWKWCNETHLESDMHRKRIMSPETWDHQDLGRLENLKWWAET